MRSSKNVPYSYPGARPLWKEVDAQKLLISPYSGICEILVDGQRLGTGWLAKPGLVVTAAHVLRTVKICEMRFSASDLLIQSQAVYRIEEFDVSITGSTSDMVCIAVSEPAGVVPLEMTIGAIPKQVTAVGFPARTGSLVEHTGIARMFQRDFVAHSAHTRSGHSGCPVLVDGLVVGLHLGDSTISKSHIDAGDLGNFETFMNVALALDAQRVAFISAC